jgi:N-acetylneuraminic acid mutarotase
MRTKGIIMLCVAVVTLSALLWTSGLAGGMPSVWSWFRAAGGGTRLQTVVPSVVSYQGQVHIAGTPFDGKGYFKFVIVDPAGPESCWSNDGTSSGGGEPDGEIQLTVINGLFNVLLGDTSLPNMTEPLLPEYIAQRDCYLRVWFSPDGATFQQLSPDRRVASVPYALIAEEAVNASTLRGYAPGNISGRIPINNGTLNTDLNADKVDGQHGAFYRNASNIDAGTLSTDHFSAHADLSKEAYLGNAAGDLAQNNGVLQQTLNADAVDGQHALDLVLPSGALVLGTPYYAGLIAAGYTDLGPSTLLLEMWRSTSTTSAPHARQSQTTVWTGSEMIVWGGIWTDGGYHYLNDGGRYNPATDTWTPISTVSAPDGRQLHTAVWTGSEMLVWGGYDGTTRVNTGGRYNPATDTWTPMSTLNAPEARTRHTAVWNGSEMIVWGGQTASGPWTNTGGRYNPTTDTWTATTTTGAPSARQDHTAVWAGNVMVVWGGGAPGSLDTGGRYNPATDTWTDTTTTNAPDARYEHTAVWTGSEMIVWGGLASGAVELNTGGRYSPATDTWTSVSTADAPSARFNHGAVWTGREMWVWGGSEGGAVDPCVDTGGRYEVATNTWRDIPATDAPSGRYLHSTVWSGSELIVWGGTDYSVQLDSGGQHWSVHVYRKL